MYRTEIYFEEEYIDYLNRNPHYNLLMSNTGIDQVAVYDAQRHLRYIKDTNLDSYKANALEKKQQSDRAKEKSEAKRKAKQTSAYGQGPAKKGTANPVARTSPKVEAASSSTSAGVCVCGSTALSLPVKIDVTLVSGRSGTVVGTKRCRHGRVEWEEG